MWWVRRCGSGNLSDFIMLVRRPLSGLVLCALGRSDLLVRFEQINVNKKSAGFLKLRAHYWKSSGNSQDEELISLIKGKVFFS